MIHDSGAGRAISCSSTAKYARLGSDCGSIVEAIKSSHGDRALQLCCLHVVVFNVVNVGVVRGRTPRARSSLNRR